MPLLYSLWCFLAAAAAAAVVCCVVYQVCNHPDLFEGRPIVSAFDMPGLSLQYPSCVMSGTHMLMCLFIWGWGSSGTVLWQKIKGNNRLPLRISIRVCLCLLAELPHQHVHEGGGVSIHSDGVAETANRIQDVMFMFMDCQGCKSLSLHFEHNARLQLHASALSVYCGVPAVTMGAVAAMDPTNTRHQMRYTTGQGATPPPTHTHHPHPTPLYSVAAAAASPACRHHAEPGGLCH
jgi:hypothetical protein